MLILFSGMVAQCAGCNLYEPWAALLVGLMAGLVFIGLHDLMLFMKLDDPLDAVAVHMGGNLRRVQALARKFFWNNDTVTEI